MKTDYKKLLIVEKYEKDDDYFICSYVCTKCKKDITNEIKFNWSYCPYCGHEIINHIK